MFRLCTHASQQECTAIFSQIPFHLLNFVTFRSKRLEGLYFCSFATKVASFYSITANCERIQRNTMHKRCFLFWFFSAERQRYNGGHHECLYLDLKTHFRFRSSCASRSFRNRLSSRMYHCFEVTLLSLLPFVYRL